MIFLLYLAFLAVMNLIAFLTYRSDKQRAKRGEWRIRESVLISLGLFGGALGALISMKVFRHKTKHRYFWVYNLMFLILHIAVGLAIFYFQISGFYGGIQEI